MFRTERHAQTRAEVFTPIQNKAPSSGAAVETREEKDEKITDGLRFTLKL